MKAAAGVAMLAACGVFVSLAGLKAAAQTNDADMVKYGKSIAARFCGECHAIEPGEKSPLADAPPAPELYRRFPVERMAAALELGMLDNHPRMPNFQLDPDERKALTAYLSSFAPPERARDQVPPANPQRERRPHRPNQQTV